MWDQCFSVWCYGTPAMLGARVEKANQPVNQMVNFIKSRSLNSRNFKDMCVDFHSEHVHLLYHSEVRWLLQGKVLQQVHCAKRLKYSCWRRIIQWPHDSQIRSGCCKWPTMRISLLRQKLEHFNARSLSDSGWAIREAGSSQG